MVPPSIAWIRDADLNSAKFDQTSIEGVDFEGARFQDYRSDGDAPMWFMPERAQRNQMSGMLLYQESKKPNIFDRLCLTLSGFGAQESSVADEAISSSGSNARTLLDVTGYSLLVETRKRVGEENSKQYAVLVAQLGLPDGVLFERSTAEAPGEFVRVSYHSIGGGSMNGCKN